MIDTSAYPQDNFTYSYLAGPTVTKIELDQEISVGNCRFAIQLYFYKIHHLFFERDEIYLPGGYKKLGNFIFKEEPINFDVLITGDVIFAQNLRNKEDKLLNRGVKNYKTKDDWLYHFHSAIYLGQIDPEVNQKYIWHATSIDGGPSLWTLDKFEHYYKPISAKRVI